MFKFDPKNMDDFANKIKNIMPESLKSSKEEMQKTLKSGAEGVLQKLDLVSREVKDNERQFKDNLRTIQDSLKTIKDHIKKSN